MSKDIQFLRIAKTVSEMSKCSSRQIGAIIVKNGTVVSVGYNGSPKGSSKCQNPYKECMRRTLGYKSGEGLEICPAVHAEMNAIVQAAQNGISVNDCVMYAYCGRPCKWCMSLIINSGIKKVVCLKREVEYDELSGEMAEESGIEIVQYDQHIVDQDTYEEPQHNGCPTYELAYYTLENGCDEDCNKCWAENGKVK